MPQNVQYDTQGRRLLARYLKATKTTQAAFATRVGVCQQTVSDWLSGKTRPEGNVERAVIERIAGVSRDAWLLRTERKRIRDAAKAA